MEKPEKNRSEEEGKDEKETKKKTKKSLRKEMKKKKNKEKKEHDYQGATMKVPKRQTEIRQVDGAPLLLDDPIVHEQSAHFSL